MIFYNLFNRFKKYVHKKSRLDRKYKKEIMGTGFIPIAYYDNLMLNNMVPVLQHDIFSAMKQLPKELPKPTQGVRIIMELGEHAVNRRYIRGTMKMKAPYGKRSTPWKIEDGKAVIDFSPKIFRKTGTYTFSMKVIDEGQILYSNPVKLHYDKMTRALKVV